ncbi:MAG: dihydrolipoamide dehydrogenase [delta proteobacterium ML8_F1]|nr:MAG: dihydrolipoamide dehydrogenase [delta proteobacterium ML8_F1]
MKILVLGGGPGGYVAAIRGAQLGAEVTLVERQSLGGTCLNVGCIPTKVLLNTTDLVTTLIRQGDSLGLTGGPFGVDWTRLQQRKQEVVATLVGGVASLLENNQITVIQGTGELTSKTTARITTEDGDTRQITFDRAILATGSVPSVFPIPGIDNPSVLISDEILALETLPKSLVVVGGGVIGVEFANLFSRLGVEVTVIEMLPGIVDQMEEEVVAYLESSLREDGVQIHTRSKVEGFAPSPEGLAVTVKTPDATITLETEKVLLAMGRRPLVTGIGLENLGIKTQGGISVNGVMQTSVPEIYAVGDCTGGAMLAHVASAQGIMAAEHIMGQASKMALNTTPYCVYTHPEIASVGLTEKQVKAAGYDYVVGRFPLMGNGKALILGETEGLIKWIAHKQTGEILGLHIAGPKATELIVEGALALRLEATAEELITTIHAHPTLGESLMEGAHGIFHHPIHLPK